MHVPHHVQNSNMMFTNLNMHVPKVTDVNMHVTDANMHVTDVNMHVTDVNMHVTDMNMHVTDVNMIKTSLFEPSKTGAPPAPHCAHP